VVFAQAGLGCLAMAMAASTSLTLEQETWRALRGGGFEYRRVRFAGGGVLAL